MRWFNRDIWKAGIVIVGMLLLLVFVVWLPVSAVDAHERVSGLTVPGTGTVQAAPTEDATVTTLTKEKLESDIRKDLSDIFWAWTAIGTIVVGLAGVIFSFLQFLRNRLEAQDKELKDRQNEREKRAEERFQAAVTGLGDQKEGAKIGAAILLRTFLHPGYEEFYVQTFDLAVANLRLPRTPHPSEAPDGTPHPPEDPNTPLPLTTLSQALITVFKESFPLAREMLKKRDDQFSPQLLDASRIQLDNAFLAPRIDLKCIWMREAFLREAHLNDVDLSGANLRRADLSGAYLSGANLRRADLSMTDLSGAHLNEANLSGANIEKARSLIKTDLRGVNGLTKEQLEACKAKGAFIDEEATVSSSQSTASTLLSSQSSDAQAPSASPIQGSIPTPDTGVSSAASSKPSLES